MIGWLENRRFLKFEKFQKSGLAVGKVKILAGED